MACLNMTRGTSVKKKREIRRLHGAHKYHLELNMDRNSTQSRGEQKLNCQICSKLVKVY